MYQQLINLYSLFWPRLYVWLRLKILPLDQLEKLLPDNGSILDVGSGYGFSTIYFAKCSTKRQVKGIELEAARVKVAQSAAKGIKNVSFMTDNLANQEKQNYQTIVLIDLLHHLSSSEKKILLKQCFQLLPSQGLLLIKDINTTPTYKYLWNYLHDLTMTRFNRLEFLNSIQMSNLLTSSGFKVIKKYPLKHPLYPHFVYVCKKP